MLTQVEHDSRWLLRHEPGMSADDLHDLCERISIMVVDGNASESRARAHVLAAYREMQRSI